MAHPSKCAGAKRRRSGHSSLEDGRTYRERVAGRQADRPPPILKRFQRRSQTAALQSRGEHRFDSFRADEIAGAADRL
jgi:hypothetical protein